MCDMDGDSDTRIVEEHGNIVALSAMHKRHDITGKDK